MRLFIWLAGCFIVIIVVATISISHVESQLHDRDEMAQQHRAIGTPLQKLLRHDRHVHLIRDAVVRTHVAVVHVTTLLNIHLRRKLEEGGHAADLSCLFDRQYIERAFMIVTTSTSNRGPRPTLSPDLVQTRDEHMPAFNAPSRQGLNQVLKYAATDFRKNAENNVWMNFHQHVLRHVRLGQRLSEDCLLYTSPSPRDLSTSRMPSSA